MSSARSLWISTSVNAGWSRQSAKSANARSKWRERNSPRSPTEFRPAWAPREPQSFSIRCEISSASWLAVPRVSMRASSAVRPLVSSVSYRSPPRKEARIANRGAAASSRTTSVAPDGNRSTVTADPPLRAAIGFVATTGDDSRLGTRLSSGGGRIVRLARRLGGGELLRGDERGAKLKHQLRRCLQRFVDSLRRQGHRRGHQAWIARRIGEGADVIHQRSLALDL